MARVKRGVTAHKRHKRLLNAAEGRKGTKSRLVKPAREALLHALAGGLDELRLGALAALSSVQQSLVALVSSDAALDSCHR